MLVVGAGVIGSEMASIFTAFDGEVTLVEYLDDVLPNQDKDIKKRAKNLFKRKGINIKTSTALTKLTYEDGVYKAILQGKKKTEEVETDYVLLSTGRVPFYGGLHLDKLGIVTSKQGITVNEHKQTNIPTIYAIGDVNGELMLAHKATYDGYKAINHILKRPFDVNFDLVPSVVFSFPEIASVGLREEDMEEGYKTNKFLYKTNAKAECMNETDGFIKLIIDKDRNLAGCHIIGAHASDLIHEATLALQQKM
jgi:dihydrolipoamide dehydrogenase